MFSSTRESRSTPHSQRFRPTCRGFHPLGGPRVHLFNQKHPRRSTKRRPKGVHPPDARSRVTVGDLRRPGQSPPPPPQPPPPPHECPPERRLPPECRLPPEGRVPPPPEAGVPPPPASRPLSRTIPHTSHTAPTTGAPSSSTVKTISIAAHPPFSPPERGPPTLPVAATARAARAPVSCHRRGGPVSCRRLRNPRRRHRTRSRHRRSGRPNARPNARRSRRFRRTSPSRCRPPTSRRRRHRPTNCSRNADVRTSTPSRSRHRSSAGRSPARRRRPRRSLSR